MSLKTISIILAILSATAFGATIALFQGSGVYCSSALSNDSCHVVTATSPTESTDSIDFSLTPEVGVMTERGVGSFMDYIPSSRLIVNLKGKETQGLSTTAFNPFEAYNVIVTKRLDGDGMSTISRNAVTGALSVSDPESPQSNYVRKDAVVILDPAAGTKDLTVNASSGLNGFSAGDVIVVADSVNKLTVKADGYDGKAGESPLMGAAKKAIKPTYPEFKDAIPKSIADAYKSRRVASPTMDLGMDADDLNNYKASGLTCRSDETPLIGTDPNNSLALDNDTQTKSSMPITIAGREQAKRTLCRRPTETSATQFCAAEAEYSWQMSCNINPESRSFQTFKREPIRWQRNWCAGDVNSQIRRKIVRQANISISLKGSKTYNGLISRTISFDDSAQVYIPNAKSAFNGPSDTSKWITNCSDPTYTDQTSCEAQNKQWSANGGLYWFNPFWMQETTNADFITTANSVTVANNSTSSDYPAADITNPTHNTGARLSYIPRPGSQSVPTLLFPSTIPSQNYVNTYGGVTYTVSDSCANLIDVDAYNDHHKLVPVYSSSAGPKKKAMVAPGLLNGGPGPIDETLPMRLQGTPSRYPTIESLLAFDSRSLAFSLSELADATGPGQTGVIKITNCSSFEVMDAVISDGMINGDWAMISGEQDASDFSNPSSVPTCGAKSTIGSEVLIQYAADNSCYVTDPNNPPSWLIDRVKSLSPGLSNTAVTSHNLSIDDLGSQSYGVMTGDSFPSGSVPTAQEVNREFVWPSDMTAPQIDAVSPSARDGFCVEPEATLQYGADGLPSSFIQASSSARRTLSRSLIVQKYVIQAQSGTAVPSGEIKKTCNKGIRLDVFLSMVRRPTCRAGTSSKIKLAWWSDLSSADTWLSWSKKDIPAGTVITSAKMGPHYSFRSEALESRYDDLPPTIMTTPTHKVDTSLYIKASESATGSEFPSAYGFKEASGARSYAGWTRETSLANGTTSLAISSFSPYAGISEQIRKELWCNAPAFVSQGGKFLQGFGAKGAMREPAKHVYGFNLSANGSSAQRYVAIEVTGTNAQNGFYANTALPTATDLNSAPAAQGDLFKKKSYPNIGGRFVEKCATTEIYNQFTGFCHAAESHDGGSWRSTERTVERYTETGFRAPWAVSWNVNQSFIDGIKTLNAPFLNHVAAGTDLAISIKATDKWNHLSRLGLFRPVSQMASIESGLDPSVVVNRPETLSAAVRGPFFAEPVAGGTEGICSRVIHLIAVPVPAAFGSSDINPLVSVVIDPLDESLPDGSVFITMETECSAGDPGEASGIGFHSAILKLTKPASGPATVSKLGDFKAYSATQIGVAANNDLSVSFSDSSSNSVKISDIRESMVSGMSATTGSETLTPVAVSVTRRGRAAEWTAANRQSGSIGWQSQIITAPTVPSTDNIISALSCSPENLVSGVWKETAAITTTTTTVPASTIYNSSPTGECLDGSGCALTSEELSLFTQPVDGTLKATRTKEGIDQYTPWSFELVTAAPHAENDSGASFNMWTPSTPDGPAAPTPSCDIFKTTISNDLPLPRKDFNPSASIKENRETSTLEVTKPGTSELLMSLPLEPEIRRSQTCIEWDTTIGGKSCLKFAPSMGRSDLAPYVFGGNWSAISVLTVERASQACGLFERDDQGTPTGKCDVITSRSEAESAAYCQLTSPTASLCKPCVSNTLALCAPWMLPTGPVRELTCGPGPGGCGIETFTEIKQVETSVSLPGQSGQNGTDGGSVTVFCGTCGEINVSNRGGYGGAGSVSTGSDVSKTLTCASWNQNTITPKFFVRSLTSRPFINAGNGQNGTSGLSGGDKSVYTDLTPEVVFMISDPTFWQSGE